MSFFDSFISNFEDIFSNNGNLAVVGNIPGNVLHSPPTSPTLPTETNLFGRFPRQNWNFEGLHFDENQKTCSLFNSNICFYSVHPTAVWIDFGLMNTILHKTYTNQIDAVFKEGPWLKIELGVSGFSILFFEISKTFFSPKWWSSVRNDSFWKTQSQDYFSVIYMLVDFFHQLPSTELCDFARPIHPPKNCSSLKIISQHQIIVQTWNFCVWPEH